MNELGVSRNFVFNDMNTTVYGPSYTDAITSYSADWVLCEGDYALCYYANCTQNENSAPWTPTGKHRPPPEE